MAATNEEIRDFSNPQEDSATKQIRQSKLRRALDSEIDKGNSYRTSFIFHSGGFEDQDHARKLILRLSTGEYLTDGYIPSLGEAYKTTKLCLDEDSHQTSPYRHFKIELHDNAYGKNEYVPMLPPSLFRAHRLGAVICIDLSRELNKSDIQAIGTFISDIKKLLPLVGDEAHILFVGTNSDKLGQTDSRPEFFSSPENLDAQRKQAEAAAKDKLMPLADKNGVPPENIFVVSAKKGTGCEALLMRLGELSVAHMAIATTDKEKHTAISSQIRP